MSTFSPTTGEESSIMFTSCVVPLTKVVLSQLDLTTGQRGLICVPGQINGKNVNPEHYCGMTYNSFVARAYDQTTSFFTKIHSTSQRNENYN